MSRCLGFRVAEAARQAGRGSVDTARSHLHPLVPRGCWRSPPKLAVVPVGLRRGMVTHLFHGVAPAAERLFRVGWPSQVPDPGQQVVHVGALLSAAHGVRGSWMGQACQKAIVKNMAEIKGVRRAEIADRAFLHILERQ